MDGVYESQHKRTYLSMLIQVGIYLPLLVGLLLLYPWLAGSRKITYSQENEETEQKADAIHESQYKQNCTSENSGSLSERDISLSSEFCLQPLSDNPASTVSLPAPVGAISIQHCEMYSDAHAHCSLHANSSVYLWSVSSLRSLITWALCMT